MFWACTRFMKVIEPFGGKTIPFYEKFFLGGERSIRGFEIYTLGPRDKNGYDPRRHQIACLSIWNTPSR